MTASVVRRAEGPHHAGPWLPAGLPPFAGLGVGIGMSCPRHHHRCPPSLFLRLVGDSRGLGTRTRAPPHPPSPPSTALPSEAPLLPVHAAAVFLAAVIIGLVMGCLMFLHDKSVPAAVATGLVAVGGSVPVLHKLIV